MFGVYLFALGAYLSTAGANIGIGLILLATLSDLPRFWNAFRQTAMLWVMIWTVLAVMLSSGLDVGEGRENAAALSIGVDVLKLWIFLPLAWWLGGSQKRILMLLALVFSGFILGGARAMVEDPEDFAKFLLLDRPSFGFGVNAYGQYAAAAFLGLIIAAPRLWRWLSAQAGYWRWPGALCILFLSLATLHAVIASQSRSAWLVLAFIVLVYCVVYCTVAIKALFQHAWGKVFPLAGLILILAIGGVLMLSHETIVQRFAFVDPLFLQQLWSGDVAQISHIPVRERLVLLQIGFEYWLQKPWFGWGFGATADIIMAHSDRLVNADTFNDLHNIAVDLLLSLGVFGASSLLVWLALVFHALYLARRNNWIDKDIYWLLAALLALFLLCQMTDFRLLTFPGRFYWTLIAGAAYTCWFNRHLMPTPA